MTQFGLSATGFLAMRQQDIMAAINASLQQNISPNINLGPASIVTQLVTPFAAQLALVWELGEGIYGSQYPGGAEGTSVDNILALNNLKRLPASETLTNAEPLVGNSGITQFGLVLFGAPGTVIGQNSIAQTSANPPLQFQLSGAVTIGASVNAVQTIVFNNVPTVGAFSLSVIDNNANVLDSNGNVVEYNGNALTTQFIPFNAVANKTYFALGAPSSGTFTLTLIQAGNSLTTGSLNSTATASQIQTAIQALTGYSAVTVTVSSPGFLITWGAISNPLVTINSSLVGATLTEIDSVQAAVNNLHDSLSSSNNYPFTDVVVSGSFSVGFQFSFGSLTSVSPNLSSGAQPISLTAIASNTLFMSTTFTTMNITTNTTGQPAMGVGSASCTQTGPNSAVAGTIDVIGTPVSGWTGVTNQLDALVGSNVEDDTQALIRRLSLLAAQGNGPLQSIIAKVKNTVSSPPITAALGFQNLSDAALQNLGFSTTPTPATTFKISIGSLVTAPITINNNSNDAGNIQSAIQALSGYLPTLVNGNTSAGFSIDFNGSTGGQAQPLITISANGTGATITPAFGRPPHSIEMVVQGGALGDIANAIFESKAGGIQTYGNPFLTAGNSSTSSNILSSLASTSGIVPGMFVAGPGILQDTYVLTVSSNQVTLNNPAIATGTGVQFSFTYSGLEEDAYGNEYQIYFSRPMEISFFVTLSLTTDLYNVPGDSLSGYNPSAQFSPSSVATIVADLVAIGNAVPIGGRVVGFGSSGLIGAFNGVPGIVGYTLFFGTSASPVSNAYIQLLPEQLAVFESIDMTVSFI